MSRQQVSVGFRKFHVISFFFDFVLSSMHLSQALECSEQAMSRIGSLDFEVIRFFFLFGFALSNPCFDV